MDPLIRDLRRIRLRLLAVRGAEAGLWGATWAAGLAIFLTLLRVLQPQAVAAMALHPTWPVTLIPAGFVFFALYRLLRGVSLREAAIEADRAAHLKNRLATALEVLEKAKRGLAKRGRAPFPVVSEKVPVPVSQPEEPPGPGLRQGLFDDRLIAQAREAADTLDASHLQAARVLNRRLRSFLVATLLALAGAFVPPIGGPPLAPGATANAAARIHEAAGAPAIAPAIRSQVEKALERLQAPGATRSEADQATQAIYQAARTVEEKRQAAAKAVAKIDSPEVQAMVRAAKAGDGAGAASAADALAEKVGADPGSGGMPLEDRQRLADSLAGAAAEAKKADFAALAGGLERAASAVKKPDPARQGDAVASPAAAAEAMKGLATQLAEALGDPAAGGVPALVAAVRKARTDLGLPDLPPAGLPGEAAPATGVGETPALPGEHPAANPATGAAGTGVPTVPSDVKPEDRDVVRRYFGG